MTTARSLFATILTTLVAGVMIGAFFVVGSPSRERLHRFDDQRSQNLQAIRYEGIDAYVQRTGKLPDTLEDVRDTVVIRGNDPFTDPETGAPFGEYLKTGEDTFVLCGVFAEPSDIETAKTSPDVFWTHPAGRACFSFREQLTGPTTKTSVPVP